MNSSRASLPPIAILCGGLGTRLLPLTAEIPKALVEVAGEPFIAHQLRLLRSKGAERIVLCVGHLGEMIQAAVGTGAAYGLSVRYSQDGPSLLGTAGSVRKALPLLGDSFIVTYGDTYLDCDYVEIARTFRESRKSGLMTIFKNDNALVPSNVEFDGRAIVRYDKHDPTARMRYVDYGASIFAASAFVNLELDKKADLTSVLQRLLADSDLACFEVDRRFYEIGSPGAISEASEYITNHERNAQ